MLKVFVVLIILAVLVELIARFAKDWADANIVKIARVFVYLCIVVYLLLLLFGRHVTDIPIPQL